MNVVAGTQTITAPVVLDSNLTISAAAGTLLTVSGPITVNGHAITVIGPGKVIFSGPGSSGLSTTTVASGKLVIQNSSLLADGSNLTVGNASFFAAAPAVAASAGVPASAGANGLSATPAVASKSAKAAATVTAPAVAAYSGGPSLPLWLRPHLIAAAAALAEQDAATSNPNEPAALLAMDAFFARFGR
jgi:hypothetical protein